MATLDGGTVIVTGAGSGIGRSVAIHAAQEGAHVIVTDVRAEQETAQEISEAGGSATALTLDVSDADAWASVVDATLKARGRIDGLVNVAGVVAPIDTVVDQTEEGWARIVAINLTGPWLGMRATFPSFIANGGGRVVNVASLAGNVGMPNLAAYSASKGGLIGLSRQAAIEYAAHQIKVNVICPGIIETPILGEITKQLYDTCVANTPAGRLGQPADIARTAVHLLGEGGDFITGQVINIDGGWSAH